MKIYIPVLGFGKSGGYRVLSKLADELIRLGHSVQFINSDTSADPYYPTSAGILWADHKGNLNTLKKVTGKKATAFSIQLCLLKALKKIDTASVDIILANHSLTTWPIKLSGLKQKAVYYVQAYEPEFYKTMPGIKNGILKILSAYTYRMKLFTIVNAEIYLTYKEIKASRFLYPGIDFNVFYPLEKEKKDEIIIGTIGRLERFKGTHYVLDAYNRIRKKYPEAKLHVAFGDPKDFENYEGVTCFQPHGDKALAEFYRSLDYYFCGGFIQLGAFHYPVAEAMSCGVSLITTPYYPADHNNSWLVIPENAEDIVEKFEAAYGNGKLRQEKIQNGIRDTQQFNWESVGKKLNRYLLEFIEMQEAH